MAQLKDLLVSGVSRLIGDAFVDKIQITTLNAPTSAGGTTYNAGTNGQVLKSNGSSIYWTNDTNTWTPLSTSAAGYVSQAPNDTTKFLRGDASWAQVSSANLTDIRLTWASSVSSTDYILARDTTATGTPLFRAMTPANLKTTMSLNNVENTKLSTWTGSSNITTLGTISSGNIPWARLTGVPSSFTPATHTHYELTTIGDQRSTATTPNTYSNKLIFQGLKSKATINNPTEDSYSYVLGLRGWSDSSGGDSHELAFNNTGLYHRSGATTSWNDWEAIGNIKWKAITQGQKWSRICLITPKSTTEGSSGILSISCTRASVVVNNTFVITTAHSSSKLVQINQVGGSNYSSVKIRGVCSSNGTSYIELYDTANSIASGTTQTWHCSYEPLLNSQIVVYTTFTDGTTIPSGYTAYNELTTFVGDDASAIVNISRNGTTFTATRQNGSTFTFTQQDNNSVTGVKGNSESSYRTGNVNITAANIGLGNVENKSSATIRGELTSSNVTTALGFTPYNSTNPNGYTTNTGTVTSVTLKAGTGISLDTDNTAITTSGTRTITNSGVRATTINGNYLRVNTNGTDADLTIPYAKISSHASAAHFSTQAGSPSGVLKVKINAKTGWMLTFTLRVYQAYSYQDFIISGYNYGSSHWYSPKVIIGGGNLTSKQTVTFGYDNDAVNSYCTLWISIPIQQYTGADIFNVTNGYTQISDLSTAFEIIHETTSTGTAQTTVDAYRPWYRDEKVSSASNADSATSATTASKLSNTSKIGDTNQPVYFTASGVPSAISYTIGKSVPSDAVFTDEKLKVETLNGTNADRGVIFSSNGEAATSTAYTTNKLTWNDSSARLRFFDNDRQRAGVLGSGYLGLMAPSSSYLCYINANSTITANRNYTLPASDGTLALLSDIPTIPTVPTIQIVRW